MIDRPTEPRFNDRWPGESDATWGDRPGIVASLLRYRVIVVAATLLGLAFVKTPLIGYVYVRPRGLGVRALWEQVTRPLRRMPASRR